MKIIIHALALLVLLAVPAAAQDTIVLNIPKTFPAPTAISGYDFGSIFIEMVPVKRITIRLAANGELQDPFIYPCPPTTPPAAPNECTTNTPAEVQALINIVNNGNHTSTSLWRKINIRIAADFPSRFPGGAVVK